MIELIMEGVFFKMDIEIYEKITETSEKYKNFIYRKDKQERAKNTNDSFDIVLPHGTSFLG